MQLLWWQAKVGQLVCQHNVQTGQLGIKAFELISIYSIRCLIKKALISVILPGTHPTTRSTRIFELIRNLWFVQLFDTSTFDLFLVAFVASTTMTYPSMTSPFKTPGKGTGGVGVTTTHGSIAVAPSPPRCGGNHSTYGLFIGGSKLDNDYKLVKSILGVSIRHSAP